MRRVSSPRKQYRSLGYYAPILFLFLAQALPSAEAQTGKRGVSVRSVGEVRQWPSSAKRFALIIGVDQYTDKQITPLTSATNDAKLLAKALVENAGFGTDQVVVLTTDQPPDRQPTRRLILKELSNLARLASHYGKDGLLLVAFAGHGIERAEQAFLLPSDAIVTDDVSLLEESAVSLARVHDWIRSKQVGQVVVLLDACRTDPTASRSLKPNRLTPSYTRGLSFDIVNHEVEAFATIYATGRDQQAYENLRKKQGFFMEAVVEALRGAAANEKGLVTLGGLLDYVEKTVPKRVSIEVGAEKEQRPWAEIKGYKSNELVIASTPQPLATSAMTADQYAKKGEGLARQERWVDAETQYRKALELEPDKAQYHFNLAEAMYGQQKLVEAENEYRRGLQSDPNRAAGHIGLSTVLQEQKRWPEAEAELREGIKLEPNDSSYHARLGSLFFHLQKWAEAEAEYTKAVILEPKTAVLRYNLAVTLVQQQKWTKAEAEAQESIRLDQANIRYQDALKQIRNAYAAPTRNSPPSSDTTGTRPDTTSGGTPVSAVQHKQAGDLLVKQKQWEAAAVEYKQALQLEPQHAEWHNDLATTLFNLQKWPAAETEFREAIRLEPNNVRWRANLGNLLAKEGKWSDVEREYTEAVRLDPNNAYWHSRVGASLMAQKKYSKAESAFKESVRLEPNKPDWYYQLGRAYHEQEKWKEAEEQYIVAIRLDPKKAVYRFNLGFALAKRSKWHDALDVLRATIRLDPNNAVLRSNFAIVLTNVKMWGEAEIEMREAMRLDPISSKYRDLLKRITNKEWLKF